MGKSKQNKGKAQIYTDLALETAELLQQEEQDFFAKRGVKMDSEEVDGFEIKVTTVEILNQTGVESMGKPVGKYITLESEAMKNYDVETHEKIIALLADQIAALCPLQKESKILVVGLGNWLVTPDALGPKVVKKILVTRQMMESLPDDIQEHVRTVSAISPGVMGLTGIETSEIIQGIVEHIAPDLVIAVDALASRCANRINATIQLSNTGVAPGAGMGNKRKPLNQETLGIPVLAIGVPTVVDAATLVNDTMDLMLQSMIDEMEEGTPFFEMLQNLESEEKYEVIKSVLDPYTGNMFVTPKDVDAVVERLSNIIANAINISMHPGIDKEDINRFVF